MALRPSTATIGLAATLALGCADPNVPETTFYAERIDPIVQVGCVLQTTGCHLADDRGRAVGNLDMSSYDALLQREDTLPPYGPYPLGLLLLKAGEPADIAVDTLDPDPVTGERYVSIRTDIRHNAGAGIALDSAGFAELKRWIAEGYSRTGVRPERLQESREACVSGAGSGAGFDPGVEPDDRASFDAFVRDVQPVLRASCAGGDCHGVAIADYYLSCGETPAEQRWNYFISLAHLSEAVSTSELLRRPLASARGGTFHEGGDVWSEPSEPGYQTVLSWAQDVVARRPDLVRSDDDSEGFRFFANRVQPVLVRKGCMFLNCHSPPMFHDLRLRGGSLGSFSRVATARNYELSVASLALESTDPNDSRIIAKNLFPSQIVEGGQGILHRGGSLFEDFGTDGSGSFDLASVDDCEGVDADAGDLNEVPAYCVLARWHQIERQERVATGELFDDSRVVDAIVWVARPPGIGAMGEFDTFRGDADLRIADVTLDAEGRVSLGGSRSLLDGCGLGGSPDVRNPAVSWDGARIAFAARASGSGPLRLYEVLPDGSGCAPIAGAAPSSERDNGILTHDLDPAWAPDGRLVFASTRGNLDGSRYSYAGPQRTPARDEPNANLYLLEDGGVRQLTFLLNQELAPSFLHDGRAVFTAEKREPGFHQMALRRIQLDGGDYHPEFAQRGSVGFDSATEIVALPNGNLAFVAAPLDATDGAGTIVIVNRSIGPDQDDRDPDDRFFMHSMFVPVPGAFGPIPDVPGGRRTTGAFRSPAPLPTGRLVVSCVPDATMLRGGGFAFELCEMDPDSGDLRVIGGEAGRANIEAVAVYARPDHGVFSSRGDEANAVVRVEEGQTDAIIRIHDLPLLGTLLFSNTREGRPIDDRIGGLEVLEALPPGTPGGATQSDEFGTVWVNYRSLGSASTNADASLAIRIPGGVPIVLRPLDHEGRALTFRPGDGLEGEILQREQMQFYPGERSNQIVPRRFFNSLCGGCHGSVTGRELDVVVDIDAITQASETVARDQDPVDIGDP